MAVMSSPRNRCRLGVDNPIDDDGFWEFRKFKANRRTGGATGGRLWRRTIRTREKMDVRAEIEQYYVDVDAEIRDLIEEDDAIWGYPDSIVTWDDQPWQDTMEEPSSECNGDCPMCRDEQDYIDYRIAFGWDD